MIDQIKIDLGLHIACILKVVLNVIIINDGNISKFTSTE